MLYMSKERVVSNRIDVINTRETAEPVLLIPSTTLLQHIVPEHSHASEITGTKREGTGSQRRADNEAGSSGA